MARALVAYVALAALVHVAAAHVLLDSSKALPLRRHASATTSPLRVARAPSAHVITLRGGAASFPGESQWNAYLKALENRPIPTKMATAAVLSALGDVIAQSLSDGPFVLRRMLVLVAVNVLYIAPLLHGWYNAFEWFTEKKLRLTPGTWKCTLTMLCCDQLVNSPTTIACFFAIFGVANALADAAVGQPLPAAGALVSSIGEKLRVEYVHSLIANWKVWVLPQLLNFGFVPPPLRVGFANIVAVVWNTILSIIANR